MVCQLSSHLVVPSKLTLLYFISQGNCWGFLFINLDLCNHFLDSHKKHRNQNNILVFLTSPIKYILSLRRYHSYLLCVCREACAVKQHLENRGQFARVGTLLSPVSQKQTHPGRFGHLCVPKICTFLISVIPAHYRKVSHFRLHVTAGTGPCFYLFL